MSAPLRVGSLCTGYGGIELGLSLVTPIDVRWVAEANRELDPLRGEVPNLGDITRVDWSAVDGIDLLTAGFPCQPVSAAGRQRGDADERWVWSSVRQAIAETQPTHVLLENVRNLISTQGGRLWSGILADLEALGYGVRWLTLGACHVGAAHHRHRVFALGTMGAAGVERIATSSCGAKGGELLPTPTARDGDGRGTGDAGYWDRKVKTGRTNGFPLDATLALLPTPRATDGVNGGPGQRGSKGDLAMPSAVQPEHWGQFAGAVARHEAIYGPAPAPTEPNRNGAPRLSAAFAEWLMCLPAGHVTAKLPRTAALKAIGNGVCPPQLAAAWRLLMNDEAVVMPARTWGDEDKPAVPAPKVLVCSDDAAPVPVVAGAIRTAKAAEAAGWTVEQTYAVASVPATARKVAHMMHTVCVRVKRGIEHGFVMYVREDKLAGADGVDEGRWSFGSARFGTEWIGARQVAQRLARPPQDAAGAAVERAAELEGAEQRAGEHEAAIAAKRAAAAPPAPADPPPAVPGTWGSVHAGDVIQGADGRGYRVRSIVQAGQWVGSGTREVSVVLEPVAGAWRQIILHRAVTEPAAIAERADHTEAAGAYAAITAAGMTAHIISEGITVDQFSAPAPAAPSSGVKRDRFGRYLLPHPETGVEQAWTRVSTVARAIADEYSLTRWKLRQAIKGLASRADLIAGAAAADPEADRSTLDSLADKAMEIAGSSAAATMGTALHSFTARLDTGTSLDDLGHPAELAADLVAYRAELGRHGLNVTPELVERIVVLPEYGIAGTFDRIVTQPPGPAKAAPYSLLDLKTGKDLAYAWLEIAIQQAFYAHASYMWEPATQTYVPLAGVPLDRDRGLILHLPVGKGRAQLYAVNLIEGWRYAQLAVDVRAARSTAKSLGWLVQPDPVALLRQRVSIAPDQAALAALWDQGQAAGTWTDDVQLAAAQRWEELQAGLVAA